MECLIEKLNATIVRAKAGDPVASNELGDLAYQNLKLIAERVIKKVLTLPTGATPTLGPTALVSEGYLCLVDKRALPKIKNAGHLFAWFARVMRQKLIDYERNKQAEKRGRGFKRFRYLDCEVMLATIKTRQLSMVELEDSLKTLRSRLPRTARIMELKLFLQFTHREIALAMKLSEDLVRKELKFGRAVLGAEFAGT